MALTPAQIAENERRYAERQASDTANATQQQESNDRVTALLFPNGVPARPAR